MISRTVLHDLAVATEDEVVLLFAGVEGSFSLPEPLEGLESPVEIRALDMDGEGAAELAVALRGGRIVLLGEFAPQAAPRRAVIELGRAVQVLESFDVDRDRRRDLVACGSGALFVCRALAGGGLAPPERFIVGDDPRALAFADFDQDGCADVVTADFGSRGLSILAGGCGPAPFRPFLRADTDGDGGLSLTDAVVITERLFLGRGPLPGQDAADTDDDGTLDLTDAVLLLLYLFRGGAPPPAPFPDPGVDPTDDALTCL